MSYDPIVSKLASSPEALESAYQEAVQAGEEEIFKQAITNSYTFAPNNMLLAAWYFRLKEGANQAKGFAITWGWVIPLALMNGLLFWWLSDDTRYLIELSDFSGRSSYNFLPALFLMAAPISAAFVLAYFTAVQRKLWRIGVMVSLILIGTAVYVLLVYRQTGTRTFQEQYLNLMLLHLPMLAWAGVAVVLLFSHRDATNRFAFLSKSLELFIMIGLFGAAGGVFIGITFGLFQALDIRITTLVQRLFIAGGGGLIPVVATAVLYDPTLPPARQSFEDGLSRLVTLLMRLMLPLTLLVLLVYLAFIPFNFAEPFDNREVLVIFNGMLFAVVVLLVGATPMRLSELSPQLARWLRWAITAVAAVALIISLYALAAIIYRTAVDRLTPNRLAFIGWNIINIGLLILILLYQRRAKAGEWVQGLYRAYSLGTVAYLGWIVAIILLTPWLFSIRQGNIESLPLSIQEVIYEQPDPILLKCATSDHIYLLSGGEKRWVRDLETFENRGYVWSDVEFVPCDDLRTLPDGDTIPRNAGQPPQP